MSGMDKYIMDVDYDCETGEEHTTIVRTDKTQNMENWEILVTTMYTHHSIFENVVVELNRLNDENEQLKKALKRCRDWINSDKNDYELTLAFIKSKGYSLKDVLEYEKELEE